MCCWHRRREGKWVEVEAQSGASEALPVDDGGSSLIVLLLADPHLLEGGQRGEDGAADPHGVLPLRGGDDLNTKQIWR